MLVARIIGLAAAIALGVCILLYVTTGERRYLRLAWRLFKAALFLLLAFLLLLFGERLVK